MTPLKVNQLNAKRVQNLDTPGYFADGGGLYLQISKQGTKSWVFRFKSPITLKKREMGLGSILTVSLAIARKKAMEARLLLDEGIDPLSHRDTEKEARAQASNRSKATFSRCAEQYIETHSPSWKNSKHHAQWQSTLSTYAYPVIGDKPVSQIDEKMLISILKPIWQTKQETASRIRGRIEKVLDWATAEKYRSGENPARWKGHLEHLLGKQAKTERNQPALPYKRMSEFMEKLQRHQGNAARALEFTILTACRSGEVRLAKWEELDLAEKTWSIPVERMKAGKAHTVPLSSRAIELLTKMPRMEGSDYVFFAPMGGALSDMALTSLIRRMHTYELKADELGFVDPKQKDKEGKQRTIVVHGFRSSFRDWAGETTSYPREVIEMGMAHGLKDKAEAAYARGNLLEKRVGLMQAWANYCYPQKKDTVVSISKARA